MLEEFKKRLSSHEKVTNYRNRKKNIHTPGGAFNLAMDIAIKTAEEIFAKKTILKILKKENITSSKQDGNTGRRISKEEVAEIIIGSVK